MSTAAPTFERVAERQLGSWLPPWWLLLTTFAGLNLFQSAFTGFCPAEMIFRRLGLKDRSCSSR